MSAFMLPTTSTSCQSSGGIQAEGGVVGQGRMMADGESGSGETGER
jgi:hypothetical protein